jgi:RHS repeat-associated protein
MTTDSRGNSTEYRYDANGNVQHRIDAKGVATAYRYDPLNRLTDVIYPADPSQNVRYDYDANGNMTRATGPTGIMRFDDYNENNQLLSASSPLGDMRYTYDILGNRSGITYPGGVRSVTYPLYDNTQRLKTISTPSGDITFSYDETGNRVRETYPNATSTLTSYDGMNRLMELQTIVAPGSGIISSCQYSVDEVGNRTGAIMQRGESSPILSEYGYSRLSHLIWERTEGAGTVEFRYDARGNRRMKGTGATEVTYEYDAINELLKLGQASLGLNKDIDVLGEVTGARYVTVNGFPSVMDGNWFSAGVNLVGGFNSLTAVVDGAEGKRSVKEIQVTLANDLEQYAYDANGNLISRTSIDGTVTEYAYDYENRLSEVKRNGSTIAVYTYDALGRRDRKTVSGVITKYVYDGLTFNPILELNGDNTVKAIITRGPDMGGGIGGIVSMVRGDEEYWCHYNHRGDVTTLTNSAGEVVQTYQYDAFGNLSDSTGAIENPYRFSTKEWDEETGFYYFGKRYYAPELGRFINQDPLKDVNGLNQYVFALNNPLSKIDPLGESAQDPIRNVFLGSCSNSGIISPWKDTTIGAIAGYGVGMGQGFAGGLIGTGKFVLHPVANSANTGAMLGRFSVGWDKNIASAWALYKNKSFYEQGRSIGRLSGGIESGIIIGRALGYASNRYYSSSVASSNAVTGYSQGGIRYGPVNDAFLVNASKAKSAKGMLDVAVHGSPRSVSIGDNVVNHRVLAHLIEHNPEFNRQAIRLLSCETGCLADGFAQNLANKIGVAVYAPDDIIWAYPDGSLSIGPLPIANSGDFMPFLPGGVNP